MEKILKFLQIAGEIGGFLALLVTPHLYFENRKLRKLAARKNRKVAQAELEKLERNEEGYFEEKMNSLPAVYGKPFEMEGFDTTKTQQEIDATVRRKENYGNDAAKLRAEIEEQEEIENMSTFRGLFGLKPKEETIFFIGQKQTLITQIRKRFRKLFAK